MKFQLMRHGWPVGQWFIPEGTIIDASSNDEWSRLARGRTPPSNAIALDQEAADAMLRRYPKEQMHVGPGVIRR
jgi:hypothetical protein